MDKRLKSVSLAEQLELRRNGVRDVLAHPEWPLARTVNCLRKAARITTTEYAKLARVHVQVLRDIEAQRSDGTVEELTKLLQVFGLSLGVVRSVDEETCELLHTDSIVPSFTVSVSAVTGEHSNELYVASTRDLRNLAKMLSAAADAAERYRPSRHESGDDDYV